MLIVSMFLIILMANGFVIPLTAWIIFCSSWIVAIIKAIDDNSPKIKVLK